MQGKIKRAVKVATLALPVNVHLYMVGNCM